MSKKLKDILNNRRLVMLCSGIVVGVTVVAGGGYFAYSKIQDVKAEKAALIAEQERLAEEQRLKEEAEARKKYFAESNIAYLTFDDGPNAINTPKILEVLKANNIKATFFMVGNMVEKHPELVKRIYEEGHTIANHTTSHKYTYSSKEAFLADIEDTDKKISEAIGKEYKSAFVRVPGGSYGKTMLKEALAESGYIDMNWTALNGDSEKGGRVSSEYVLDRIDKTIGDNQYEVVLMHDIKSITAENLQDIIKKIKDAGYVFEALTEETPYK